MDMCNENVYYLWTQIICLPKSITNNFFYISALSTRWQASRSLSYSRFQIPLSHFSSHNYVPLEAGLFRSSLGDSVDLGQLGTMVSFCIHFACVHVSSPCYSFSPTMLPIYCLWISPEVAAKKPMSSFSGKSLIQPSSLQRVACDLSKGINDYVVQWYINLSLQNLS